MICPKCGGKLIVLDSRPDEKNNRVRRRKQCEQCGERITTIEFDTKNMGDVIGKATKAAKISLARKITAMLKEEIHAADRSG